MKTGKVFSLIGIALLSSFAFGEKTDNVNSWGAELVDQIKKESHYNGVGFSNSKSPVAVTQQMNALIKRFQSYAFLQKQLRALKSIKENLGALMLIGEKLESLRYLEESSEALQWIKEHSEVLDCMEENPIALQSIKNNLEVLKSLKENSETLEFIKENPGALQFVNANLEMCVREAKRYKDMCQTYPPSFVQEYIPDNFFVRLGWPSVELVEKLFNTAYEILSSDPDFNGYKFWQTPGYEED